MDSKIFEDLILVDYYLCYQAPALYTELDF